MQRFRDRIRTLVSNGPEYARRGLAIVPLPYQSKKPVLRGWPKLEIAQQDIYRHLGAERQNVGVILGTRSGGLVDIDLDSPEAVRLATFFLPPTDAVFGRKSKPSSHYLYKCADAEYKKFNSPLLMASQNESERKDACIVEIRVGTDMKGIQTVFPPSVHESGERVEWLVDSEPESYSFDVLGPAVCKLAAAALLVECWHQGIRHELSIAVAGTLLRNGYDKFDVIHLIKAVCTVANDDDLRDRIKAVEDTHDALLDKRKAYGLPKFVELTDKKLVNCFCEWLGISNSHDAMKPAPIDEQRFQVVCMQDVKATEVEWLWKPFIPVGEFTIIEGIEGIGKSWIGCALACAVASGATLPFDDNASEPASVILLSAEDSLSHTLRPRLDSMGAPLDRIFAMEEVFSLNNPIDLSWFESQMVIYKPKLVILDPMFSYTEGKDLNTETGSRPFPES